MLHQVLRPPRYALPPCLSLATTAPLRIMDTGDLVAPVHFAQVTRYSHLAAYSVFVFDWILTLHQECQYLLHSSITRGKLAYIFCRYWPLLTYPITMWVQVLDHDPTICEKIYRIPMFLAIPNLAAAAGILILRIYAFTGGKRSVLVLLLSCLVSVMAFQVFVAVSRSKLIGLPIGCYPVDTGSAKYLSGYFMAPLLFDCITTATFAFYAVRQTSVSWSEMGTFSQVFIREGACYFLAISSINIVNGAMNFQPNVPMATVAVPLSLLLANLLACRLVLNLRSAVAEGQDSLHPLSVDNGEPIRMPIRVNRDVVLEEYALDSVTSKHRSSSPMD
ncbi:hypothetical protein EXIGLDRAFT_320175 [Exidia glandulosa HHB12029]|uniref:DUF6533 domain-containing protein n=1 Tax=Exidia glandulosa HHB12029 TaxID=1314781 RepID=A0A166BQ01_EXIGL|nr:hypothetical protein EXIGLDRAFT_320175 [Exidia glandulosa HHB12029]